VTSRLSVPRARGAITKTPNPVRVAVLDAGGGFAEKLSIFISTDVPELEVVLVATTWAQLVADENFPTRVVFLDADATEEVSLPARIRACRAAGAVVILTTATAEGSTDWAKLGKIVEIAGAKSVFSTTVTLSALIDVADRIDGLLSLANSDEEWRPSPQTMRPVHPQRTAATASARPKLSRGESEALALYASGKTVVEVGRAMNVKYETAKTFLRRVREKYAQVDRAASNRAELTLRAEEDGFVI
jgi:DNA-binding CsgD family transcriptional regulator